MTADIPSLIFVTDSGIEVKRSYNKFTDSFGGYDHADIYDANLSGKQLAEVAALMSDKPRTYEEYLHYVQSNKGEQ